MKCYATQTNWTGLGRPVCRRWQHGLRLDQLLSFSGRCEMSVGRTVELLAPPHQTTRVAKLALTGPQAGQPASRQARIYPPDATRWGSTTLERANPLRLVRPWRNEPGFRGGEFQYSISNVQYPLFKWQESFLTPSRPPSPRLRWASQDAKGNPGRDALPGFSTNDQRPTTNDHCPQLFSISIAHARMMEE